MFREKKQVYYPSEEDDERRGSIEAGEQSLHRPPLPPLTFTTPPRCFCTPPLPPPSPFIPPSLSPPSSRPEKRSERPESSDGARAAAEGLRKLLEARAAGSAEVRLAAAVGPRDLTTLGETVRVKHGMRWPFRPGGRRALLVVMFRSFSRR